MSHNNKRWQFLLLICLFCIALFTHAQLPVSVGFNQHLDFGEIPDGLSASDWSNIQAQVKAGKYNAYPDNKGGYHSSNPTHGWQIRYAVDGTTTLSPRDRDAATYQLCLKLTAIGYDTLDSLHHPQQIRSQNNTLDYHWNDILTERWVNSEKDLEQWFFLNQRPQRTVSGKPLILQMTLDSVLSAKQNGNSIHFTNSSGTTITYNKLRVWDTTGRQIPAHLQLNAQLLSLIIDDSKARYPLTIDPSFQQQAYLKASNAQANDNFGASVAIADNTMVVGAFGESSNATGVNGNQSDHSASGAGAAYVFTRSGKTWNQQAYLKASNTQAFNFFGSSVAIAGDTVVVGAFGESSHATGVDGDQSDRSADDAGAVYVFSRSNNTWSQQAYLKASNTEAFDQFGISVAIAGNTVVVSADREASNAFGVDGNQNDNSAIFSGAAYVFFRNGSIWSQQAYLKASNTETSDHFGSSVAITGNTVVVGADREASNAIGFGGDQNDNSASGAGAAYVFSRSGNTWSQQAYLKASNTGALDQFGSAIAIAGNTMVVGADREASNATGINGDQNNNSADAAGAAYVFFRNGNNWSQQAYLKASNTGAFDQFGLSVAIANETVVIGAFNEDSATTMVDGNQSDNSAETAGAVYAFTRNAGAWSQQTYLKASNTGTFDQFGSSVAIANNTVVVGANGEASNTIGINGDQSDNSATSAGATYVFNLTTPATAECTLDVDNNGNPDALTDGLLIIRHLFGIRDESLIANAVATNCSLCSAGEIKLFLDQCATTGLLDIDGNGNVDALSDGLLSIRYLFGNRGQALIVDSVGDGCSRCTAVEIEDYLQRLVP
jgi:hypothetical protein